MTYLEQNFTINKKLIPNISSQYLILSTNLGYSW